MKLVSDTERRSGGGASPHRQEDEFCGEVPRTSPSIFYQVALLLAALTMLALPVLYAAYVGLFGYATFRFAGPAFHYVIGWDLANGGYLFVVKFVIACLPAVVGTLSVVFMVKPLFAGPAESMCPIELLPEAEPRLFRFLENLCRTVGAPMPKRVQIDCEWNASVGFCPGPCSFLRKDLVLIIGLPLVAGLNMQSFTSILAHELGHFTQGAGIRCSYLIRLVDLWMVRSIDQRDSWDDWLDSYRASALSWVAFVAELSGLGIALSRIGLRLLRVVGNFFCSLLLRQMEFDADNYSIQVTGSDCFEKTMGAFHLLNEAAVARSIELRAMLAVDCLALVPDDFPALIAQTVEQITPEMRERILTRVAGQWTWPLSSHPSYKRRIKRARKARATGVFASEEPARNLFTNFEADCKSVTLEHYRSGWRVRVIEKMLTPVSEYFRIRAAKAAYYQS
jgi:Zn-dependent protease with chaperone function